MPHTRIVLTAGFAMFSMFFGSGNLVFPLFLGQQAGDQYLIALAGLFVTAVIVPFLGLLALILYAGDRQAFFENLGRKPAFLLTLIMMLIMGPFGVVPRCITVAFGSIKVAFPNFSFPLFNALFCLAVAGLIWQKNRVVEIIGIFLTPWKLGGIIILILAGLWTGSSPTQEDWTATHAFIKGAFQGYQTMDLIAAFFFGAAIVHYLKDHLHGNQSKMLVRLSLSASFIGAGLLTIIYMGFVAMGAKHSVVFGTAAADELLTLISKYSLGHFSTFVVSITLTVACLATAVILSELFVEFLETDITQDRLSHPQSILITLGTTFGISLLGFSTIAQVLGKLLTPTYPALIVFTLACIFDKVKSTRTARPAFWATLIAALGYIWIF